VGDPRLQPPRPSDVHDTSTLRLRRASIIGSGFDVVAGWIGARGTAARWFGFWQVTPATFGVLSGGQLLLLNHTDVGVMPTRSALTRQSLRVMSVSYATLLAVLGLRLAKN
jgi:hypothetical protein